MKITAALRTLIRASGGSQKDPLENDLTSLLNEAVKSGKDLESWVPMIGPFSVSNVTPLPMSIFGCRVYLKKLWRHPFPALPWTSLATPLKLWDWNIWKEECRVWPLFLCKVIKNFISSRKNVSLCAPRYQKRGFTVTLQGNQINDLAKRIIVGAYHCRECALCQFKLRFTGPSIDGRHPNHTHRRTTDRSPVSRFSSKTFFCYVYSGQYLTSPWPQQQS
jgi:hypothetical protein